VDDVILSKKENLERCVRQVRAYRDLPSSLPLSRDFLRLDAISMNLQRAAELCLDIFDSVVEKGLDDLLEFSAILVRL
jgi:hypothetical protein